MISSMKVRQNLCILIDSKFNIVAWNLLSNGQRKVGEGSMQA